MKIHKSLTKLLALKIKKAGSTQEQAKKVLEETKKAQDRYFEVVKNSEGSAMDKINHTLKKLNII